MLVKKEKVGGGSGGGGGGRRTCLSPCRSNKSVGETHPSRSLNHLPTASPREVMSRLYLSSNRGLRSSPVRVFSVHVPSPFPPPWRSRNYLKLPVGYCRSALNCVGRDSKRFCLRLIFQSQLC
ncbi:hypothetical protein Nepgr_023285 [Nepenthes gracilis]|uniref:Uncharacterized protein n=1 Tax=Nepenthes gracilis TaxID=150966 RepID=A0AAD3T1S5_NEPGR|nr:hypothetical protein Nepgr_023285 [Nepenthes gracilis]